MTVNKSNNVHYQVFFDGSDFCAEDERGIWHVVVRDPDGNVHLEEHAYKPARFTKSELLTFMEICERGFYTLCVDIYCANHFLDGAASFSEVANLLDAEIKHVKSLEKKGWEFIESLRKGHARFHIPLKPHDSGDSNERHHSINKRRKE